MKNIILAYSTLTLLVPSAFAQNNTQIRPGIYLTSGQGCLMRASLYRDAVRIDFLKNPENDLFCDANPGGSAHATFASSFAFDNPFYNQNYACNSANHCLSQILSVRWSPGSVAVQDEIQLQSNGSLHWLRRITPNDSKYIKEKEISTTYYYNSPDLKPSLLEGTASSEDAFLSQRQNCAAARDSALQTTIWSCHEAYGYTKCKLDHIVSHPGPGVTCTVDTFVWGRN